MSDPSKTYCYDHTPAWMRQAVAFLPNGDKVEGEYDGYGGIVFANSYIAKCIQTDEPFEEGDDIDEAMFRERYITTPCCYHRACWEAVGKPEGHRGGSLPDDDQGFGSGGSLHFTNGFHGIEEGDELLTPPTADIAVQLWVVNSIFTFFRKVGAWIAFQQSAEERRRQWEAIEEGKEALRRAQELLGETDGA